MPDEILKYSDGIRGQTIYWDNLSIEVIREGESVEFLIKTGQIHDMEVIIHYQNDLDTAPMLADDDSLVDVGEPLENS